MQKFFLVYNKSIPVKKSWGQNFLIDPNTIRKIIDIVKPNKNENILEIGPGHGALTDLITKNCNKLYAVEIDPLLCNKLKEKKYKNLILYNEDILDWEYKADDKLKIVGNLPYYISSPIIFKFLNCNYWESMTIMLQKEVAQRISSKHNIKQYSRISVMCQTFCKVEFNLEISKNAFHPKPKVDSAIITLKKVKQNIDIKKYSELIKLSFSQRRKTLKNNLKKHFNTEEINKYNLIRPQELTIEDYIQLYKKIYI